MLVFAAIMPHPPESIPNIGTAEEFSAIAKTLQSFEELRIGLEQADPDTIIIISPHARLEAYSFVINSEIELRGSFSKFGLDEVLEYKNNIIMVDKIGFAGNANDLSCHLQPEYLDHGALIPLFHLLKNIQPKVVHLSFSLMNYERHFRYGEIIRKIIDSPAFARVAVIASGDLSHTLNPDSPAGFCADAKGFDRAVLHFLGSNDVTSLMGMEQDVVEQVRECGLRSVIILLGILHGKEYKFDLLSYEAPSGIGYLTARLL